MTLVPPPKTSVSGWRRHPLLWANWLAACNAVRRFVHDRRAAGLTIVVSIAVASILGWMLWTSRGFAARAFAIASDYRGLAALLLGLYAALASNSRRAIVTKAHAESWLAATPIRPARVHQSITLTGLLPLAARALAACFIIALLGVLARQSVRQIAEVGAVCGAGMLVGMIVGWWLPRALRVREDDDSRYLPVPSAAAELAPSLDPLAGWPMAQTRAWSRPENARLILVAALFAVQGGSSALHGLCVVATWLVGAYLSGSLAALVRSAREAAQWLRTTPISFARFAWPLARRTLLRQLAGTVVALIGIVGLGSPWGSALYCGVLWLTAVVVIAAISLADSYRGRGSGWKVLLSLSAMAGIESRHRGGSIPLAVALIAWHLRRRVHA
jgi:hypothetical protein